jgi:very-short-patch-repair endonuclease
LTKRDTKETLWKGAPASIFANAKALRERMTPAETLLWEELRQKKFMGLKFRRQHPILYYVADFYCHSLKLIIEIDGGYHLTENQKKLDKERSENLNHNGIKVIRFTNDEVENNRSEVLRRLGEYVKS